MKAKPENTGIIRNEKGQFPKGVSGNPAGRPEGSVSIVGGIRRKLLEVNPENKKTYLDSFLETLFKKSVSEGNEQLMRDMINRIDGMPKQTVEAKVEQVIPLLKNVQDHDSTQETPEIEEKD